MKVHTASYKLDQIQKYLKVIDLDWAAAESEFLNFFTSCHKFAFPGKPNQLFAT
jgi:hypothetical protein